MSLVHKQRKNKARIKTLNKQKKKTKKNTKEATNIQNKIEE